MFKNLVLVFILIMCFAPCVRAEDEILPQKRELIKELLIVTNYKQLIQKTMDSSYEQLKRDTLPQMLDTALKQRLGTERLDRVEPEKLKEIIGAASIRIGDKIKQRINDKVDITKLAEDVVFTLYNKYFTEKELQGLLDFYNSPVGVKAISIMPQLTADSMKAVGETTNKITVEVYLATLKEEIPVLMDELFPSTSEDDE